MKSLLPFVEYYLRPLPGFRLMQPLLERLALWQWQRTGRPPAPRSVKAAMVRRFATTRRRVLVETGTFYGDMLEQLRDDFDRLISIELSPRLARRARRRFAAEPRFEIRQGDSGQVLGDVLRELARPAVLWLDGHYSGPLTARGDGDTPLAREVDLALCHGTTDDVILVDDARLLGTDPDYPTVDELRTLVASRRPDWRLALRDDALLLGESVE